VEVGRCVERRCFPDASGRDFADIFLVYWWILLERMMWREGERGRREVGKYKF